jgi:DNA-binding CsgD family transcriptional regulator
MGAGLLEGLPELTRVLSSTPHPDEVAAALVEGPGRQFGAVSAAMLWAREGRLIVLGLHGWLADELSGLDSIPRDVAYPVARAFREGEVLIDPMRTTGERYPALLADGVRWQHTMARFPDGVLISGPITAQGRSVGAYAMTGPVDRDWTTLDLALLSAVSSALGLWMAHPDTGLAVDDDAEGSEIELSERQRRILLLVETGRTNHSIAVTLGYSASTVKQELRRLMVLLGTPDRDASARQARTLGLLGEAP